eukprot:366056-Chlamydomonas_euryale.AAC.10
MWELSDYARAGDTRIQLGLYQSSALCEESGSRLSAPCMLSDRSQSSLPLASQSQGNLSLLFNFFHNARLWWGEALHAQRVNACSPRQRKTRNFVQHRLRRDGCFYGTGFNKTRPSPLSKQGQYCIARYRHYCRVTGCYAMPAVSYGEKWLGVQRERFNAIVLGVQATAGNGGLVMRPRRLPLATPCTGQGRPHSRNQPPSACA